MSALSRVVAVCVSGVLLLACGGDATVRVCNVNADCASGICLPDGSCAPVPSERADAAASDIGSDVGSDAVATADGGGGGADGGAPQDSAGADGEAGGDAGGAKVDAGPGPLGCVPNGDGVITGAEVPIGPGLSATFRVAHDVDDYASACGEPCVWDLADAGGDAATTESWETLPLDGWWFAPEFTDATHVVQTGEFSLGFFLFTLCEHTQYGVFRAGDDGMYLLGVVGETSADGTLLVYDPPVPVLQYPLELGATWTVETDLKGKLCNFPGYVISQTWASEVDRSGSVVTPYGTFDGVLRVNTLATRHASFIPPLVSASAARTHTYVAECFTTIATAVSEEFEDDPDFTSAVELRTLSVTEHD